VDPVSVDPTLIVLLDRVDPMRVLYPTALAVTVVADTVVADNVDPVNVEYVN